MPQPSLLSLDQANRLLDHPYGMCWPKPQHSQVLVVERLPLALVEKWSVGPLSPAWGPAHAPRQCPDFTNHGPCTHSGCRVLLYADGIKHGSQFPPIAVICRLQAPDPLYGPWLVDDGMHRISALRHLGHTHISALVAFDTPADLQAALELARTFEAGLAGAAPGIEYPAVALSME